jgi:hypothetical protein
MAGRHRESSITLRVKGNRFSRPKGGMTVCPFLPETDKDPDDPVNPV